MFHSYHESWGLKTGNYKIEKRLGVTLFEKHAAPIQGEWFTILNREANFETDIHDKLVISATIWIPHWTFADLSTTVQNSFTFKESTLKDTIINRKKLLMERALKMQAHAALLPTNYWGLYANKIERLHGRLKKWIA